MSKFLNFRCKKCSGTMIKWTRLPPKAARKHRVTCNGCDCFVGWGKVDDLQGLLAAGQKFVHIIEEVEPSGATLKGWFTK